MSGVREGDGAGVSDARTGLRIMAECIERGLAMIGKEETEMLVKRQDAEDIRTVLVALETPLPTGPLSDEALRRMAEEFLNGIDFDFEGGFDEANELPKLVIILRRVATEAARLERERIEGECPACRDRESKLRGAERFRADVEAGKVMLLRRIKGGE